MKKNILPTGRWFFYLAMIFLLTSCGEIVVFESKGVTGIQERNIIIFAMLIMAVVIVPVMFMAVWFPYKYRKKNRAEYDPKFIHSTKLELVVWGVPIIIVIVLAVLTYFSSHSLDPYKPLESEEKPIEIEVVALNWKWLFIYPEYNIATVNEIHFPKNRPVNFKITSDAPMNSFFIPQLGAQIYAMAGMQTKLHLEAIEEGNYRGISSNYSGGGFAGMRFQAIATRDETEFLDWVEIVRGSSDVLDRERYRTLRQDSEFDPVTYFAHVESNLFQKIMSDYASGRHGEKSHQVRSTPHLNDAQSIALAEEPQNRAVQH